MQRKSTFGEVGDTSNSTDFGIELASRKPVVETPATQCGFEPLTSAQQYIVKDFPGVVLKEVGLIFF
jgi:hypothetical protein